MSLTSKLAEVAKECGFAKFDAENSYHKYKYASASSIIGSVNRALAARGVAVSVTSELLHFEKGHAVVRLSLSFRDGDEVITTQGIGEGSDKGDKAIAKSNTSAYKYALAHALVMSWGAEDPEADSSVDRAAAGADEVAEEPKPKKSRAKKATEPGPGEAFKARIEAAASRVELEAIKLDIIAQSKSMEAEDKKLAVEAWNARSLEIPVGGSNGAQA